MPTNPRTIYVAISTLAHVYAFLWILLMLISLGDTSPIFYLPQSFAWSVLWIIWHVCDHNPHTRRRGEQKEKIRAYIRQVSSMFLLMETTSYFAWAIYEWTIAKGATEGASLIKVPAVFYGLLVATTFGMSVTVSIVFFVVSYYHEYQ